MGGSSSFSSEQQELAESFEDVMHSAASSDRSNPALDIENVSRRRGSPERRNYRESWRFSSRSKIPNVEHIGSPSRRFLSGRQKRTGSSENIPNVEHIVSPSRRFLSGRQKRTGSSENVKNLGASFDSSEFPTRSLITDSLSTGSSMLPTGSSMLPTGSSMLPTGSSMLPTGFSKLSIGSSMLLAGSSKLSINFSVLPTGSSNLSTGSLMLPTGCPNDFTSDSSAVLLPYYHALQSYLWPVMHGTAKPSIPPQLAYVIQSLSLKLPSYGADIKKIISESEKSSPVDVISLLGGGNAERNYLYRNNGELVEVDENTFRDKYILVCCFHIPIFLEGPDCPFLQALVTTCFELYSTRNDVEIVVVAKVEELPDCELFFNHFLQGFPSSCLVVPFEDSKRRDYICYYIHLRDHLRMQCLLLDKGKDEGIVNWGNILFSGYPVFASDHGADAFPFTTEKLEELDAEDFPKWKTASTSQLEGLLGCTPSDELKNINPAATDREEISISELKEKVVGLYLCVQGNLITMVQDICQQCSTKQLSFEVVLVYLPFSECLDHPEVCILNMDLVLKHHNLSCWRLPFKNSVSRRLYRLMGLPARDKLIIVGAHDEFVEPYGGKVYRDLGIDAYPFYRESLVQRELDKVKEHTLESLLVYGSRNYVIQGDKKIAVSELIGRNILLYRDSLFDLELFDQVLDWYYEIKANDPTFEVVFVRRNSNAVLEVDSDLLGSMPWLVCPYDIAHSDFLEKKFFTEGIEFHESLVEFGKNGRICSFRVENHLTRHGPEGFPFGNSHLRCDVIEYLCITFKFMRCGPDYEVFLYD